MTSEHPYPGQTSGTDPQDAPHGAPTRPPFQPGSELTPFSAFGGGDDNGSASAPPAAPVAARAAVRIPGLVTSVPPVNPPTDVSQSGRVYGRPASAGAVYGGSPAPESPPARTPEPTTYGTPAPRVYGQPYAGSPTEPPAQPVQAATRPAVATQRSSTVYGQRQPAESWPEPPQASPPQAAPAPQAYQPPPGFQPAQAYQQAPAAPPAPPDRGYDGRGSGQQAPAGYQQQQQAPQAPAGFQPAQRPQFEQHGRQTQDPGAASGYESGGPAPAAAPVAPRQRTTWQEQLAPMVAEPRTQDPARSVPIPAPADVAIIRAAPKSKLRIVGYIAIAVFVVLLGAGALYYTARTDPPQVGSCVAQASSGSVVQVSCSSDGAFKVGRTVTKVSDCPDYLNQPSIRYGSGGSAKILCLLPASSK